MKLAVHIDGPNWYASVKEVTVDAVLDYTKLLSYFQALGYLSRVYYYSAVDRESTNGLNGLLRFLERSGYTLVSKPVRKRGGVIVKSNMDVEIALGLVRTSTQVDELYLLSGDEDFTPAVVAAQDNGARVTVISSQRVVSSKLAAQADRYLHLERLWETIDLRR